MNSHRIVSIDDREDDNYLLSHAVRKGGFPLEVKILRDGQEAIEYFNDLDTDSAMPDFILLDLKMPRRNGFEVLDWIRGRETFKNAPVGVLTSSQDANDIRQAYEKGAEWYLVKPVRFEGLLQLIGDINEWIATRNPDLITQSTCFRPRDDTQN